MYVHIKEHTSRTNVIHKFNMPPRYIHIPLSSYMCFAGSVLELKYNLLGPFMALIWRNGNKDYFDLLMLRRASKKCRQKLAEKYASSLRILPYSASQIYPLPANICMYTSIWALKEQEPSGDRRIKSEEKVSFEMKPSSSMPFHFLPEGRLVSRNGEADTSQNKLALKRKNIEEQRQSTTSSDDFGTFSSGIGSVNVFCRALGIKLLREIYSYGDNPYPFAISVNF